MQTVAQNFTLGTTKMCAICVRAPTLLRTKISQYYVQSNAIKINALFFCDLTPAKKCQIGGTITSIVSWRAAVESTCSNTEGWNAPVGCLFKENQRKTDRERLRCRTEKAEFCRRNDNSELYARISYDRISIKRRLFCTISRGLVFRNSWS